MPAAAVIPAPIVYIKIVAVKKLVVGIHLHFVAVVRVWRGFVPSAGGRASHCRFQIVIRGAISGSPVTLSKMECLKQRIRIRVHVSMGQRNKTARSFIVFLRAVMVDRDNWGY